MYPLVSILIPVYNCHQWVAQAIESALQQTWPNKEIIVLDDGSTDESLKVIRHYEKQIQIESTANGGQNVSRNRLTALSRGEWLAYLDADDELAPDCIDRKMKYAPSAEVIFGSSEIATFNGLQKINSKKEIAQDYPDAWVAAVQWRYPNTSAAFFNRKALLDAGGWNESVKNCTDYSLYFSMLLCGHRFKAASEAWSLYRQWSATQAAVEDKLRMMTTRLGVMRGAAHGLRQMGQMTSERTQAFLDSSLAVIRIIYTLDPKLAIREHQALREWLPNYHPSREQFPAKYIQFYNTIGFAFTERLANLKRTVVPKHKKALPS
jgi:glycosyltransferase involved in cell wall biosynthesis